MTKTYGDVFTLWMAHNPMVILNGQATIREALLERRHEFGGRFQTKMAINYRLAKLPPMLPKLCRPKDTPSCVSRISDLHRKYAVSDSLEKLCADVVDAYVDSLPNGPQVIDSRKPFFYLLYNVVGVSVYGTE
ncbi:hypothetical protein MTO96_004345 [Rhipicephalus appendiculatus]